MDFSLSVQAGVDNGPGFCVLVFVPQGAVRVEVGGGTLVLTAGCLLLAPPGSGLRVPRGDLPAVSFSRSLVGAFADSLDEGVVGALTGEPKMVRLPASDTEQALALFVRIAREVRDVRALSLSLVRLRVMELLLLFVRGLAGEAIVAGALGVEEVKLFLDTHYADELSVAEVARHFGWHPASLSRAFRRETGSTVVDYVNGVRVHKSCELLKRTQTPVLEIAFFVGYHSLSHFNLIFRRYTGLSPRDYRKQAQG